MSRTMWRRRIWRSRSFRNVSKRRWEAGVRRDRLGAVSPGRRTGRDGSPTQRHRIDSGNPFSPRAGVRLQRVRVSGRSGDGYRRFGRSSRGRRIAGRDRARVRPCRGTPRTARGPASRRPDRCRLGGFRRRRLWSSRRSRDIPAGCDADALAARFPDAAGRPTTRLEPRCEGNADTSASEGRKTVGRTGTGSCAPTLRCGALPTGRVSRCWRR